MVSIHVAEPGFFKGGVQPWAALGYWVENLGTSGHWRGLSSRDPPAEGQKHAKKAIISEKGNNSPE